MTDKKVHDEYQSVVSAIEKMAAKKRESGLSEDEDKTLRAAIERADTLKAEVEADVKLSAKLAEFGKLVKNDEHEEEATESRSYGEQFIQSDAYRTLMGRGRSGAWTTGPIELARTEMANEVTHLDNPINEPQHLGFATPPFLGYKGIESVLAAGTTNSNSIRYVVETSHTSGAVATTEATAKTQSAIDFDPVDEPVRKIATWVRVSDEMMEDESALASYLDARLRLFVDMAVDAQLVEGNGTPPNISGLLDRAIQTGSWTEASVLDDIFTAAMDVEDTSGYPADFLLVSPADYPQIALAKDAADRYYGSGPYGPANQGPWGLRLAKSSALDTGTLLVGSGRLGAQVFTRGGIVVEASNADADNFTTNLVTIRAETRKALAVYNLDAFKALTK